MEQHLVGVSQNAVILHDIEVSVLGNQFTPFFGLDCPKLCQKELKSIQLQGRRDKPVVWLVNVKNLLDCVLANRDNLCDVRQALVEVQNADLFALFNDFDFILLLHSSVINEHRVTLLHLDKAGMFMYGLSHDWVALVMLFHQHQKT